MNLDFLKKPVYVMQVANTNKPHLGTIFSFPVTDLDKYLDIIKSARGTGGYKFVLWNNRAKEVVLQKYALKAHVLAVVNAEQNVSMGEYGAELLRDRIRSRHTYEPIMKVRDLKRIHTILSDTQEGIVCSEEELKIAIDAVEAALLLK